MKRKLFWILLFIILVLFGLFFINLQVLNSGKDYISNDPTSLSQQEVALVLGAKVYPDGKMSDMLMDRVETVLNLYNLGKIKKILLSGDHGHESYDEVNTMKNYLLQKGVPAEVIFLDHAGFDTYDSLYRAREIFQIKNILIISQKFHLPRAIYIGRSLGLEAYGFAADQHQYVGAEYNELREILARIKAFFDINLGSKPKFLGPPIPISGDSRLSWD